jgi:hypothetical protein
MELHGILHDGYIPCLRVLTSVEGRTLHAID